MWSAIESIPQWRAVRDGLICVEQPFHREVALSNGTTAELKSWAERPPLIIDESDAEFGSVRLALDGGYAGTSHKNCKGVFRGIANACLLALRRRVQPERVFLQTGEDLANVGPVALLQDLAVQSALGVESVERNGHHYFRGLSFLPAEVQAQMLAAHSDLYSRHERECCRWVRWWTHRSAWAFLSISLQSRTRAEWRDGLHRLGGETTNSATCRE